MVANFNYLVCKVYIDDQLYYLDASQPLLGFGKIPVDCYNDIAVEIIKNRKRCCFQQIHLKKPGKQRFLYLMLTRVWKALMLVMKVKLHRTISGNNY